MNSTIRSMTLLYPNGVKPAAMALEQERAIHELCEQGDIRFSGNENAPFDLELSIFNHQLVLKGKDAANGDLPALILSLSPYRSIIRDYFMMIESYEKMRLEGNHSKLEPIDMARRGLHNEAADILIELLRSKAVMGHDTARRFFTLICVLHMDQARLWQI